MSDLRERVRKASKEAVQTEDVEVLGCRLRIRGMMQGERLRVAAAEQKGGVEKSVPLLLALTVYDPETDKPLWNPNSLDDVEEIRALPTAAADELQEVAARLSGLASEGNSLRAETTSSPSLSSASESGGEPSTN